ncbi:hypothetical protein GCM10022384_32700 [Streptomyces marokkonensis]|uniref:GAF domain-containing protein n=1 Tax=Streptomyces marokkonensis TaxID=324855 RepID=A0ABP7QGW8_9ACTN
MDHAAELTGAASAALIATGPGRDCLAGIRTTGPHHVPETAPRLRVPIHVGDEAFGELRLAGRPGGVPFTAEDEQLVRVLATHAGIAVGTARLYETARQRERWIEGAAAVTIALLTALRHALTDAAGRPGVTRVEVTADAIAALPDGRDGVCG